MAQNIISIFLPDHIDHYYILPKTIVGLEIGTHAAYATIIQAKGKKRVIKKFIEEPIKQDPEQSIEENKIETLKKLHKKIGDFDKVYTTISSKYIFYKHITVPFVNRDQIALMLPFEVEQSLPFKLNQGLIDFVTIKQDKERKESEILVAATKRSHVEKHIELLQKAGFSPDRVSVDLLDLCALYAQISTLTAKKQTVALLDIGIDSTRIALIAQGKLQALRVISQGIETITGFGFSPEELMRIDFEEIPPKIKKRAEKFFAHIMFTLEAARKNLGIKHDINSILLTGIGTEIGGIKELVCSLTEKECSVLLAHKIMQDPNITIEKRKSIPGRFVASLATALNLPLTNNYDLAHSFENEHETKLLKKQIITAGVLLLAIIVGYSTYTFMVRRSLKKLIVQAEQESVTRLKKVFSTNRKLKKTKNLKRANKIAQEELNKEESIWYSLSTHNRFSFLKYLQELSSRINKEKLGLELKRLTLKSGRQSNQDTLILQGSVQDYDALREFENALQESDLFENVPKLQEPNFSLNLKLATKDFDR